MLGSPRQRHDSSPQGYGVPSKTRTFSPMIERVLIVDDEPLARERLSNLVRAHAPHAAIREAGNGAAAIECIQGWAPDIVLLDIQMPAGTGFEVVEVVGVAQMPPTVFITAHDEFAIRAFDVAAVDYLLKPFDDDRFAAAWQRVSARHGTGELVAQARVMSHLLSSAGSAVTRATNPGNSPAFTDRLVVKQDQRTIVVMLSDVQWMESDANYVVLHAGRDR